MNLEELKKQYDVKVVSNLDAFISEYDIKNMFFDRLNDGYEFVTTFNVNGKQYFVFKKEKIQQICD